MQPASKLVAYLVVALSAAALACGKTSEAAPAAERATPVAAAPAPAVELVETPNYVARIVVAGACKKGEACVAQVVVEAKGDYHVNDKYPYKFKPDEPAPEGVKYDKALVTRDDAKIEAKRATLPLSFKSERSGEVTVGGQLSLSVCSEANCLMDKVALDAKVKVQ